MQREKGIKLKSIIIKNKEYILYLIFGILTTLVNFFIYYLFTYILKVNYLISNCLAWLSAVIFAFVTNKTIVFNNYNISLKIIVKEFVKFINCRLISGFIEVIGLFIIVDKLNIMDMLAKVLIGVIVIILNYIFSKAFVFNNN